MPQVSLYINSDIYIKLKNEANETGESMSKINNKVLDDHFNNSWPKGYFDLFGSLKDDTMDVPEDIPWELNAPRETL